MNQTWAQIIAALSAGRGLITLANTPPAPTEYIGQRYLPRVQRPDYDIAGGQLEISSVMAGHIGMDSRYPEGSAIKLNDYEDKTAKLAQAITLNEGAARELQKLLLLAEVGRAAGRTVDDFMQEAGLNLYERGVVQSLDDTGEYLICQALAKGKIDWTFNGRRLLVDYKIPAENIVTLTGTDVLGGSSSKFWRELDKAEKAVRGSIGVVMSQNTLDVVLNNPVHRIQVLSDTYSPGRNIRTVQIRRTAALVQDGASFTLQPEGDVKYSATLIGYGREGQIIDPSAPGETIGVQMWPDNVIGVIGNSGGSELISVTGTGIPTQTLGYYHVAPTVEGTWRGEPLGRWGRLYTPENDPTELRAEGVENGLPVIRNGKKLRIIRNG